MGSKVQLTMDIRAHPYDKSRSQDLVHAIGAQLKKGTKHDLCMTHAYYRSPSQARSFTGIHHSFESSTCCLLQRQQILKYH
jgi:hypothetical protein